MVLFDLICKSKHVFEAWFPSYEMYKRQKEAGLVCCAICGTADVDIVPGGKFVAKTAEKVSIKNKTPQKKTDRMDPVTFIKSINHYIKKNFEDVGEKFPEQVRKIYYGEEPPKNIYGTASDEERSILKEEGIPFASIPVLPESTNN